MTTRNGKKIRALALAVSSAVLVTIGSTMAYFSSTDETTNHFDSKRLDITLTEPTWKLGDGLNAVPGDVFPKDPMITNKEGIPVYAFMRVSVPCGKPEIELDTGDKGAVRQEKDTAASSYPIYKFVVGTDYSDTTDSTQTVNDSCWTLVEGYPQESGGRLVYVYAYTSSGALRVMNKGDVTEKPLFDKVRVSNFDEGYTPAEDSGIYVEAFGIQADYLGIDSTASPKDVWDILSRGVNDQ